MRILSTMAAESRVLLALLRGQPRSGALVHRLQTFYAPQAADYDRFRERLLTGRRELIESLPVRSGARVVELGAGTGRNVEFFGERLERVSVFDLVDLCPALLEQARQRALRWPVLQVHEADASRFRPLASADLVYLSYALSMMPDWEQVLENALEVLAPGGTLGVVDFFIDPSRHGRLASAFWRTWFGHDGVRLSPGPLAWLRARLEVDSVIESQAAVPWMPGLRVPVYRFIGRRRERLPAGR
jgi:S-adenosylmethionine-diacylgycerolhomoserine-N-methlytransferase